MLTAMAPRWEHSRRCPPRSWSLTCSRDKKAEHAREPGFAPRGDSTGASAGEALEPGRGRFASAPSEIPARGWKDILLRVYRNISDHRVFALAAGMTFYSLLAMFPALAALVAIYGLFSDPAAITGHLDQVSGFMPSGAIDVARDQLRSTRRRQGRSRR